MQPAKSEGTVFILNREDATVDPRGRSYQSDVRLPPHALFCDSKNQTPATLPVQVIPQSYPNPDTSGAPLIFGSSSNPMPFNPILQHDCHTTQETVLAAQCGHSRTEPTVAPLTDTNFFRPHRIANLAGAQSDKNRMVALVDSPGPDENQTDVPIRRRKQDSKGKSKADTEEPPRKRTKKASDTESKAIKPTARKQNAMTTGTPKDVQFRFISVYPEQEFSGTRDQSTTKSSDGVLTVVTAQSPGSGSSASVSDSSFGPQTPLAMDSLTDRHYNAIPQTNNARSASPAGQVNATCAASLIVGDNRSSPSTAAPKTCKSKKKERKGKKSKNTDKMPWTNKQDPVLSAKIRDHICYQNGCSVQRVGQFDKKPVLSFWCLKHAEEKYQQDPTQPSLEYSFGRCQ